MLESGRVYFPVYTNHVMITQVQRNTILDLVILSGFDVKAKAISDSLSFVTLVAR